MKKITYKLKKAVEGQEQRIEKHGHVFDFSLSEVKAHMEKLAKAKQELEAQISLEKAKQSNVEAHHEIVNALSGEQMAAVSIYYESKKLQDKCENHLKDVLGAQEEYDADLAEIEKQTGLKL
jgi:hypothetical protein